MPFFSFFLITFEKAFIFVVIVRLKNPDLFFQLLYSMYITKTQMMSVFINLSHSLHIIKLLILNGFPDLARTSSKFRETLMLLIHSYD